MEQLQEIKSSEGKGGFRMSQKNRLDVLDAAINNAINNNATNAGIFQPQHFIINVITFF